MSKRPSKNGNSRKSPDYRNDMYAGFDLSTIVPYINKVRMLLKHDKTFPKLVRTTSGDIDYKTLKEIMFMSVLPGHEQEPEAVEKLKRPWLAAMQSITVLGADNAARMHINPCRDCITGMIANHDVSYKPFDGEHDMKTLIKDMKRFDREVLSRLELEKRGLPRQVYKMITFGAK